MISRRLSAVIAAIVWPLAACSPAFPASCKIVPVMLSPTGGRSSDTTIVLSDASRLAGGAMVWDTPMTLRHADGTACSVSPDVSIITASLFNAGNRILYVTTFSESQSIVYAVSLRDCHFTWRSGPFTRGPKLDGRTLRFTDAPPVTIGTDCLPSARKQGSR